MGPRSVVLLGPPGAGKGTQAATLARARGLRHVSTGDLLRAAIASGSELGRQVRATVEAGRLVTDESVAELVGERLDAAVGQGLLLDGFPRTVRQAALLDELLRQRGLPAPLVIEIRVPEDEVVRRLAGRRTCAACGPRQAGEDECSACGGALVARPDDEESVVRERLAVYLAQTAPLTELYAARGLLRPVEGSGSSESVARRIEEVLKGC